MMPMKAKKDPQSAALDALLSEESAEHEGEESAEEMPMKESKPKGDPASLVASIQADLDRLSSLLSS